MTASRVRRWSGYLALFALVVLLFSIPNIGRVTTGNVLPGQLNSPGSLQLLAVVFTVAALATTFDLMLGYTGLFSFGHAMFFALGAYGFAMTLTLTTVNFAASTAVGVGVALAGAIVVNAVALRATAIAFAMVTLAAGQLAAIVVNRNYFSTGGAEGIPLPFDKLPAALRGVSNTGNLYWLSLSLLVFVVIVAKLLTHTRMGRTWQAIRENELRVSVMGVNTYVSKLIVAVISSTLAGVCGVVYAIVLGTADPGVTGLFYSLGLVVMVIIGGAGRIWGATLGGVLYELMVQRLPTVANSEAVKGLPDVLRVPLSEPQLLIGVLFILFIFFARGGLASVLVKLFGQKASAGAVADDHARWRQSEEPADETATEGPPPSDSHEALS